MIQNHPTFSKGNQYIPSFEQDHEYLLELSNVFEPTSQYSLDYTFSTIDEEIANYELWEEFFDGSIPLKTINYTPEIWYTQYWSNCASKQLSADLDRYEFREICDYTFEDNETIYIGHFLDLY